MTILQQDAKSQLFEKVSLYQETANSSVLYSFQVRMRCYCAMQRAGKPTYWLEHINPFLKEYYSPPRSSARLSSATARGSSTETQFQRRPDTSAKMYQVSIPDGVDAATAATVPGSALTSLFPLKCGAKLQPGETVLINGATGFTGKLAVQVARLLGAKRVIGTGRNTVALEELHDLGADAVIDLKQSDENIVQAFKKIEQVPLKDVENAWQRTDVHGKRIVIVP
jgi:hypothetical protein